MIPCEIGFFSTKTPFFASASSPTYAYFWSIPTIIDGILGLPTTVANLVLGASYPESPALQKPEPLSMTTE